MSDNCADTPKPVSLRVSGPMRVEGLVSSPRLTVTRLTPLKYKMQIPSSI